VSNMANCIMGAGLLIGISLAFEYTAPLSDFGITLSHWVP